MKKILIILIIMLPLISLCQVTYSYDANGNRENMKVVSMQSEEELMNRFKDSTNVMDTNKFKEEVLFTEQVLESKITIFPNPTYGQLRVQITNLPEQSNAVMEVYTMSGTKVLSRKIEDEFTVLDISDQAVGDYILRIQLKDKTTTVKIIKM